MRPRVVVKRYPYEEPYNLHLDVSISNGAFTAGTGLYAGTHELREIGEGLRAFPRGVPDEFVWEYGSEEPAGRLYRYFKLRACTFGSIRCALQLRLNLTASRRTMGSLSSHSKSSPLH